MSDNAGPVLRRLSGSPDQEITAKLPSSPASSLAACAAAGTTPRTPRPSAQAAVKVKHSGSAIACIEKIGHFESALEDLPKHSPVVV
jgi:hypothetical protein